MPTKPDVFPRWASSDVTNPITGSPNVIEPPENKKSSGFFDFESPAGQFFNWLGRIVNLWIEYFEDRVDGFDKTTDGAGAQIIDKENVIITLTAVDTTNTGNYLHAVGYRADASPILNVTSNNNLTLGSISADGTVAINGGDASDVIVNAKMATKE